MVTASVGGRVGDDITQCQDDEGSVRNCKHLFHIYIFLVQIPWKGHFKSGKSSVLQAQNRSFVRRGVEGFAEKFLFSFQSQSCSGHCLLRSCARLQHTSTSIFLPHCLSKVCVPAKEELFFCGLSAQVLHKLTAVVGNVLPFEAFFWHLLSLGPFPSFATISIASCSGS